MKTKKLSQYSNKQKILLVGEGDFSFSLSLARAFGCATNLTATSLDTREELELKYGNGKANIEELTRLGCTVVHGFNVHSMTLAPRSEYYDRIIFNFPHSGFGFGGEHHRYYIMLHQELVRGFLKSAKKMVKDKDGEIHITHKTAYPFSEWKIETLAEENGLCLMRWNLTNGIFLVTQIREEMDRAVTLASLSENLLLSFFGNAYLGNYKVFCMTIEKTIFTDCG